MININKKMKAFTLAELMVIMAVLTILLAAFAPIFTSRYRRGALDSIWNVVPNDANNDIFSDAPNKSMLAQSFIGITPENGNQVRSETFYPYSKVIIRSSDNLTNSPQKQIEFYYNKYRVGYLFAGNKSLLVGGLYDNITNNAEENTALGVGALNSITSGKGNTALGYNSLNNLTSGYNNTAVGYSVLEKSEVLNNSLYGNTIVGYSDKSEFNVKELNTIVGHNIKSTANSSYNTAIGDNTNVSGNYNTALGEYSTPKGTGNTAVGAQALYASTVPAKGYSYVTGIGYNSCRGLANNAKNKTCVANDGLSGSPSSDVKNMFNDSEERVFIGPSLNNYAAVLEVHNIKDKPSVIVNGDLIVRGQAFLTANSLYPTNGDNVLKWGKQSSSYPALMSFYLMNQGSTSGFVPFAGDDGYTARKRVPSVWTNGNNRTLARYNGREHCVCNFSCPSTSSYSSYKTDSGRTSYNWSSFTPFSHDVAVFDDNDASQNRVYFALINSKGATRDYCGQSVESTSDEYVQILDKAHSIKDISGSCCPILTNYGYRLDKSDLSSDARLKNIGSNYVSGLEFLEKLNVYNFTFKSDKLKLPHTGVIAQSLKLIFPNSVSSDDKGYLKIRWDEMFYAALNSVKELKSKLDALIVKVDNDLSRISKLKKEHKQLEQKLDNLIIELDKLEVK